MKGLLESVGNFVQVRVRECKSANESNRYTLENCAPTATLERPPGVKSGGGEEMKDLKKCGDGVADGGDENSGIFPSVTDGIKLLLDGDDDGGQSQSPAGARTALR